MIQYLDLTLRGENNHSIEVAFVNFDGDIEIEDVELLYNGRYRNVNKMLTDKHIDSLVQYLGENA